MTKTELALCALAGGLLAPALAILSWFFFPLP